MEGEYRHFNITYASTFNYVGSNWRCVGVWRVNIVTSNITYASTVNYVGSNWGCVGVWRVNIVTSTSHMYQPSTMWGRTGCVWVCGGLISSLQHHICINCGVELGVCGCGGLISSLQHHKPSTTCMWGQTGGVWVNTVTITSHMHQPSTMWG